MQARIFAVVLLLMFAVPMPVAEAVGGNPDCDPAQPDPSPVFEDGCYHQGVWYSPVTTEYDVIIVPPASPYFLRDIELVEGSVDMWEESIKRMAAPWLAEGLNINDYTVGLEEVPADALQDPEVVVVLSTEFHAVAVGGLFGVAVLNPNGVCADVVNAWKTGSWTELPGFHHHQGSPFGSFQLDNDCGGTLGTQRQCWVVNLNFPFAPGLVSDNDRRRTMFDLISHEVGHCLTLGHVGDADTESTDDSIAYPEHDIMSYEGDGRVERDSSGTPVTHCPSNLNVLTVERAFGHLLGQGSNRAIAPNPNAYTHLHPDDWYTDPECRRADADFLDPGYLVGRLPPGPDQDAEIGPTGDPRVSITTPQDGAEVAPGRLPVAGLVDREATAQDRDGDDVPDTDDACPDEPGPASNQGCPAPVDHGTRLGTDPSGDTGTAGCPPVTEVSRCDGNWVNPVRPGLDLRAAYVDQVDGNFRFTFEVEDVNSIFEAFSGDPGPFNPPDQPVAGHVIEVGINAAFMSAGGQSTGSGLGFDVSVAVLRGETQLTPGFDRKVQITVVGSLSGGVLSAATTPGAAGIDAATNTIWVEFSPEENPETLGLLEAIEVRSQFVVQGSGSNSVVTVDTLDNVETSTFGALPEPPLEVSASDNAAVAENECSGSLGPADAVASPVCVLDVPAGADRVTMEYSTVYTGAWSAVVELFDASGASRGSSLDVCGTPDGGAMAEYTCTIDVTAGVDPGPWHTEIYWQLGEAVEDYEIRLQAFEPTITELLADAGGPYSGGVDAPIAIDRASVSGGVAPYSFDWDLDNDDVFETTDTQAPTFTSSAPGDFLIGLRVTDDLGAMATSSATVTVSDGAAGERVELWVDGARHDSISVSTESQATDSFSGEVDMAGLSGPQTIEARWYDDGELLASRSVGVTVADAGGIRFTSHTDGQEVQEGTITFSGSVSPTGGAMAAVVQPSQTQGVEDEPLSFTATVSGGESPYTCTWTTDAVDAALESPTSCAGTQITFPTPGTYSVTLWAQDAAEDSASDSATATITQATQTLGVDAGGPYSGDAAASVSIAAVPAGGTPPYTCAWGSDSGSFADASFCATTFSSPDAGTHTLTVAVTDAAGASAQDTAEVELTARPDDVPLVVYGVVDDGINPYHQDFLGSNVPDAALRALTTYTGPETGCPDGVTKLDASGQQMPFTRHPACYIEGYPADALRLDLTLGGFNHAADAGQWSRPYTSEQVVWVPGTKIVGMTFRTADYLDASQNSHTMNDHFGSGGHGTASASVAAGALYGSCKDCLIVSAATDGGINAPPEAVLSGMQETTRYIVGIDWIDMVSRSMGPRGNAPGAQDPTPLPDADRMALETETARIVREAAERGLTYANSAGNGNANAYVSPNQALVTETRGPDWNILVGASDRDGGSVVADGNPADWSSFGTGTIPASCADGFDNVCNHSGTSSATPIATGHMASALREARRALGDTGVGTIPANEVGGKLQAIAHGAPVAESRLLADGVLQRAELWWLAFNCASPTNTGIGVNGFHATSIDTGHDEKIAGYGLADDAAQACMVDHFLSGHDPCPDANADEWDALAEQARDALWGDWDGDGDGAPGGSHRDFNPGSDCDEPIIETDPTLSNGQATEVVLEDGETTYYAIEIPEGTSNLHVALDMEAGDDWDLAVRHGERPGWGQTASLQSGADPEWCYPWATTNPEVCEFIAPSAGTWYVGVDAFEGGGTGTVTATWEGAAGASAVLLPPGLETAAQWGPAQSGSGERVELFVDGAFAGSDPVAGTASPDAWSIDAEVLGEGSHAIVAEWYSADSDLLAITDITVVVPGPVLGVQVTPPADAQQEEGTTAQHSFTVQNTGDQADTYQLLVEDGGRQWASVQPSVELAPGQSTVVPVTLSIPSGAAPAAVTVTLQAAGQASDEAGFTVTATEAPVPASVSVTNPAQDGAQVQSGDITFGGEFALGDGAQAPGASFALALNEPWFQAAVESLRATPGFLGAVPDAETRSLQAHFRGQGPAGLPLPEGWTYEAVENVIFERARLELSEASREGPPLPSSYEGIGPGTAIGITIPNDGTFGCTANFVWHDEQNDKYYLGAAGHCFLPSGTDTTHGPGVRYDASGVTVTAKPCGFSNTCGSILGGGADLALGPVVYARQGPGYDLLGFGTDFGLVEIPERLYGLVRTEMPVWNGPTGEMAQAPGAGAVTLHYGHGIATGESVATKARFGVANQPWTFETGPFYAVHPSSQGDSGSAVVLGVPQEDDSIVQGTDALGILTHLGVPFGTMAGTIVAEAKAMALRDAGLAIEIVMQGESLPGLGAPGPRAQITSPADGSTVADPVSVGGVASFDGATTPSGETTTYYLHGTRGASCVDAHFFMDTQAAVANDDGSGCGNLLAMGGAALGPQVDFFFPADPAPEQDLVLPVGSDALLSVAYTSWAGGVPPLEADVEAMLLGDGSRLLAHGRATLVPDSNRIELPLAIESGAVAAGSDLSLRILVHSALPNGFHFEMGGQSYLELPLADLGEAVVEVSVDDSGFGDAVLADGTRSWSTQLPGLGEGEHTVYARARVADALQEVPDAVTFTVAAAPPGPSVEVRLDGPGGEVFGWTAVDSMEGEQSGTWQHTWDAAHADVGGHVLEVRLLSAEDVVLATAQRTFDVPANEDPVLDVPGPQTGTEGEELRFSVDATDPDGDTVTVTAADLPHDASFDGTTFTWTPVHDEDGSYEVTFTADDGRGGTDNATVQITILDGDDDGDGVPNDDDRCPSHDDAEDLDGDGRPDGCEAQPMDGFIAIVQPTRATVEGPVTTMQPDSRGNYVLHVEARNASGPVPFEQWRVELVAIDPGAEGEDPVVLAQDALVLYSKGSYGSEHAAAANDGDSTLTLRISAGELRNPALSTAPNAVALRFFVPDGGLELAGAYSMAGNQAAVADIAAADAFEATPTPILLPLP